MQSNKTQLIWLDTRQQLDKITVQTLTLPNATVPFLPRCMECRRGLAMRLLSVRPSVCLSVCQTRAL